MTTTAPSTDDVLLVDERADTVAQMFLDQVATRPEQEAYRFPRGDQWESRTWQQTADEVSRLAAGLVSLDVGAEQRVAIISTTRYEWILADLAVMCAGAATTTVYPTTIAEEVAFIVADSNSVVVFAEDDAQVAKLRERRADLPGVTQVVTFGAVAGGGDDWVISLAELAERGQARLDEDPDAGPGYEERREVHATMVEQGMQPHIILSKERFRFMRKANRNNRLSIDALLATGFEFEQTDLAAGIEATIAWYRSHRWIL